MKKIIFLRGVTPTGTNRIPQMSYLVEILTEVVFMFEHIFRLGI